jgi:hypothetical protein
LGLGARNNCATGDNLGHDTSDCFNTESEGSDINENESIGFLRGLTTENTTLDSSTISDSLVRVDTSVWFLSIEEILNELLYLWNTS